MITTIKKLKFKGTAVVINVPADLQKEFASPDFIVAFDKKIRSTNTLFFVNDKKQFIGILKKQLSQVAHDGVLWFAYPKGNSGVKTDVNRDILWEIALAYGIRPVSIVSLDSTWSALRFRPAELVGNK